ncbi:coenzyme F420-0:L-glutamate ligase [Nocardioides nanhaiensis]|uniref:Coenzyme F420:L-glutamate ligase-like domain-containing protein n=1 Tax=Nocardioides nanhaiensis TaxID=1476871 RepID=A0ABP8VYG4_9ACTN
MSDPVLGVPGSVVAQAPDGLPEVREGDDLLDLLDHVLPLADLVDGDVLVVTSKVVSKAEGRVVAGTREELLAGETARVVARRGPTTIVRTHHGLTMAAAGIDGSNVRAGHAVLLPRDPDASAARLRAGLARRTGRSVGVVVSDTAGRAWREGQTDIAVGAAGIVPLVSFAGRRDAHGNELAVTAPAVADEVAGLAELASGKLGGRPVTLVRGLAHLVLPLGEDGAGAAALVRPDGGDLFGYGAREAVLRALTADPADQRAFGSPVSREELLGALGRVGVSALPEGEHEVVAPDSPAVRAVVFAHGWEPVPGSASDAGLRWRAPTP